MAPGYSGEQDTRRADPSARCGVSGTQPGTPQLCAQATAPEMHPPTPGCSTASLPEGLVSMTTNDDVRGEE